MEDGMAQKIKDRAWFWKFKATHEFDSDGFWVPKPGEQKKTTPKPRKSERTFAVPSSLTPYQLENRRKAQRKRRALARWKKRWDYREPDDPEKF